MTINIPTSASWRTSSGGLVALLTSLAAAYHLISAGNWNFAEPAWTAALAGIASGVSLLFARDHKVSSEEAGLKPEQFPTPKPPVQP